MLLLNLCRALIVSVHDGDTMVVKMDRGGKDWSEKKLRFARIDAFELSDPSEKGKQARDWLFKQISDESGYRELLVYIVKNKKYEDQQEKYGRWLAEVWLLGEDPYSVPSLNDRLVTAGFAVYKKF